MSAQLDLPLSQVLVFEKTGRVLWRRGAPTLKGDPLSELVGAYLLEEKGGTQSARIGDHALDWRFVNEADLVVVTAAPASMELDWTGDLCDGIRKKVASLAKSGHVQEALRESFDPTFDGLEKEFEARLRIRRKKQQADLEARKARSAEAAQRRAEAEAEAAAEAEEDEGVRPRVLDQRRGDDVPTRHPREDVAVAPHTPSPRRLSNAGREDRRGPPRPLKKKNSHEILLRRPAARQEEAHGQRREGRQEADRLERWFPEKQEGYGRRSRGLRSKRRPW